MSYRCDKCHNNSQEGEKQNKLVVEKKNKAYHYYVVKVRLQRGKTKETYTEIKPDEKDRNKQIVKQFTTRGWEITKELKICGRCANEKT